MATTVDNIQSAVAAVVDRDQDTSNIPASIYALRLQYINDRERQWSEVGPFQVLYREFNTLTSQSTSNATIDLPVDFRELAGFVRIPSGGTTDTEFTQVKGQQETQLDSTDKYVKIMGSPAEGYRMWVHPQDGGNLISGASIHIPYFGVPTSLASPADNTTCPNPKYLVAGVIADVWQSRDDDRWNDKNTEAERILANMLEFETTPSEAAFDDKVKPVEETRFGFRWGRDQ